MAQNSRRHADSLVLNFPDEAGPLRAVAEVVTSRQTVIRSKPDPLTKSPQFG
jgi:hypothetical protein